MIFTSLKNVEDYYKQFGYKRYPDEIRHSEFLLQKKIQVPSISDKEIFYTKFTITIFVYDFSKYTSSLGIQMAAEVNFETCEGHIVNVSLSVDRKNYEVDTIEDFFLDFYEKFECKEEH